MISLKVLLFVAVLTSIRAFTSLYANAKLDNEDNAEEDEEMRGIGHYRGSSDFLNTKKHHHHHHHRHHHPGSAPWEHNPRAKLTCHKFPKVCHVKGSPGRDCCKNKCVNLKKDRLSCGKCGLKCKYPEVCCGGTCVNPFDSTHHCGKCQNKCNGGNSCSNGMCNYA